MGTLSETETFWIILVVVLFLGLVFGYMWTGWAIHRRNVRISKLIAMKFFSLAERGTTDTILAAVNRNAAKPVTRKHITAALRYMLHHHQVRTEANQSDKTKPFWVAAELPRQDEL